MSPPRSSPDVPTLPPPVFGPRALPRWRPLASDHRLRSRGPALVGDAELHGHRGHHSVRLRGVLSLPLAELPDLAARAYAASEPRLAHDRARRPAGEQHPADAGRQGRAAPRSPRAAPVDA